MKKVYFLLLLSLALPFSSFAQKNQTALIQVQNRTGSPIYNVTVVHKYSNTFKEKMIWEGPIQPGQSTPANFSVRYQTGFGVTGADWWIVSWTESVDANTVRQFTTSPNNFRDVLDVYEKWATVGIPITTNILSVASVAAGPAVGLAVAGGSIIANEIVNRSLSSSSTAGFKQHVLKAEDKQNVTEIRITKKREVNFVSPSGKSNTVTNSQVFRFNVN